MLMIFTSIIRMFTTIKYAKMSVLPATTAERFFRIDHAQEHLHYITDISSEDLYILDPEIHTSFMQNGHSNKSASGPVDDADIGMTLSPGCEGHNRLEPPAAVIIQDTEMGGQVNGNRQGLEVKYTFSMPVTPPKSPG